VRTIPRPRHYVPPGRIAACRPLLAYDEVRDAYVLRGIGHRFGPVLRPDRRGPGTATVGDAPSAYAGPERRGVHHAAPAGRRRRWAVPR
jgi:hypothetical protein